MSYLRIEDLLIDGQKTLESGQYWSALSLALSLPGICSRIEFRFCRYCENLKNCYLKLSDECKLYEKEKKYRYVKKKDLNEYERNKKTDKNHDLFCDSKRSVQWYDKRSYVAWCRRYIIRPGYLSEAFGVDDSNYHRLNESGQWVGDLFDEVIAMFLYELRCNMLHTADVDFEYNGKRICLSYGQTDLCCVMPSSDVCILSIEYLCENIFTSVRAWLQHHDANNLPCVFVFNLCDSYDRRLYEKLSYDMSILNLEKEFLKIEKRPIDI